MNEDGKTPCIRCGIPRFVQYTGNRTGLCVDCKAGRFDGGRVDRSWQDDAACLTVDPEVFFPEAEDGWQPTREAKRICASCPVRGACAADTPAWDRHSIRAGMTATERRRKAAA